MNEIQYGTKSKCKAGTLKEGDVFTGIGEMDPHIITKIGGIRYGVNLKDGTPYQFYSTEEVIKSKVVIKIEL